ncbi:MAG: serine hydrolase [Gemmatimonadales bacterium]|nr:serine hydrolase [Gemmatimonadales bacterium]
MSRPSFLTAAALAAVAVAPSVQAQPAPLSGLDQYITTSMKAWQVPGLAVAVVHRGQVVLARGYGVRKLGSPEPVDAATLFAIGSATKTFTATAIGMLAEEGKLGLDEPVIRYRPDFRLADPIATRAVSLRDLLSHRTGVAGGDFLWATGEFDREAILRRAGTIAATWPFRSRFDYSNVMFIAAGQVAATVAGQSWDELVRSRILQPLGMTASVTSVRDLPAGGNVATPHDPTDGAPRPVAWRNMDNTAAAGGINSNVADMARWLQFQLAGGSVGGRQLVSKAYLDAMRVPEVMIRREGPWAMMSPEGHFMGYGLGWLMSDYRGKLLLQHGGGIDGMSAMVGLLPEADVGIVVLSNLNGNQLPLSVMLRVFDAYLGATPRDWSAEYLTLARNAAAAEKAAEKQREAMLVPGTKPALPLAQYAGTYRDETYGDLVVTHENGVLRARFGPAFEGRLEHVQFDAFRAVWDNPARGANYLNFTIDVTRRAAEADLYLWIPAHFRRVP